MTVLVESIDESIDELDRMESSDEDCPLKYSLRLMTMMSIN